VITNFELPFGDIYANFQSFFFKFLGMLFGATLNLSFDIKV